MARLLTLMVLALALVSTGGVEIETHPYHRRDRRTDIHGIANPAIGDRLITSAKLFDKHDDTGASGHRRGSLHGRQRPETFSAKDTVIQCLISAVFDQGKLLGGAVQFPEVGAVGQFIWAARGNFAKPAAKRRSPSSRPHFRTPCSSLSSDTWAKPVR